MINRSLALAAFALIGVGFARADDATTEPLPAPPAISAPVDNMAQSTVIVIGDCCERCVPKWWLDAGYGFFFLSPQRVPARIATTSTTPSLGILGQAGTVPLIDGDVDYGTFNAIRYAGGAWLNRDRTLGIDASGYWLLQGARSFGVGSDGTLVLSRPLINANTNAETASLISFPGLLAGSLTMENRVWLYNGDVDLMFNITRDDCKTINALFGFRYVYLW